MGRRGGVLGVAMEEWMGGPIGSVRGFCGLVAWHRSC